VTDEAAASCPVSSCQHSHSDGSDAGQHDEDFNQSPDVHEYLDDPDLVLDQGHVSGEAAASMSVMDTQSCTLEEAYRWQLGEHDLLRFVLVSENKSGKTYSSVPPSLLAFFASCCRNLQQDGLLCRAKL